MCFDVMELLNMLQRSAQKVNSKQILPFLMLWNNHCNFINHDFFSLNTSVIVVFIKSNSNADRKHSMVFHLVHTRSTSLHSL